MKSSRRSCLTALLALFATATANSISLAAEAAPAPNQPALRVLLLTGGHGFEKEPFFAMFQADTGIAVHAVAHPAAHAEWRRADEFDTMVLYDMWQPIDDQAKEAFLAWLAKGKGLVVLHHAIASYQAWPEYARIIGGKYFLKPETIAGVSWPASTYRHDVKFGIRVAPADHPVTKGITDFTILDETYHGMMVTKDAVPLLTTEEPSSHPVVAWARQEGKARVVYLQGGHDSHAYAHPAFRQLVKQAIRWTAGPR